MTDLPTGTVSLVFTDIEGSTLHLETLGDRYESVLGDHHRLLRAALHDAGGTEVGSAGDGLYFTFASAADAIKGTVAAQRVLGAHPWPDDVRVRDRMGIHTGEPVSGDLGYVGIDVHRAARICDAGHGGQILVSRTTRDLVMGNLPAGVTLVDLGEHHLRNISSSEHLYQVAADGLRADFPPLRSIDARPNNLPRQLTSFVGREQEMHAARRIFEAAPLLTLTGPGGVGKTRMSLELATDLLPDYEGGVWFVELGALTDTGFVLPTIALAMAVAEEPERPLLTSVVDRVGGKATLLVLDNCEHVLEAAAEAVDALLRRSPSLRVLATSREGLGIAGESVFPLPSLSLPEPASAFDGEGLDRYEAVRLFVERATAAVPSFRITEANAAAVVEICRQLDGVPLAIELAAARVRALTVQQISTRLTDRFRLLTGSHRITVPRHQTLRATMDWSFELLSVEERTLFERLSTFSGWFALEAVEAVCGDAPLDDHDLLDLLTRLVDKSLVVADDPDGEGGYRMLETIRQYGRDRLAASGGTTAIQRRHRDWYLARISQAAPGFFRGPESEIWLRRLDRDHDNVRAALQWCEDEPGEAEAGLRMAVGMWRFWEIRGHAMEGRAWLERMLVKAGDAAAAPLRADALTGAGVLASVQGDYPASMRFHEASLELNRALGDEQATTYARSNLASTTALSGDFARAVSLYERSVADARQVDDGRSAAFLLMNMADVVARAGDYARARTHIEEALATFRRLGDVWGEAFSLDAFGTIGALEGDHGTARSMHEQALAMSRSMGDQRGVARALSHLADDAERRGDRSTATMLHRETLVTRQGLGDLPGTAAALEGLALCVRRDDPATAALLVGTADRIRTSIRTPGPLAGRGGYQAALRELEASLGRATFDELRRKGARLSVDALLATLPPGPPR
ncbi:MAG: tetratricopeptide repeat protein [Candidatus Limnocylindrales bacterium]